MLQIILNGKRKETMADVIKKTTNRFTKGLVMDFSPENTKNEVLTHALNATLLTFNGNELSLQNDMGNARVETAYLPKGYMPVGTCEYGGIIYIVSYNPLENKSQIGCFPSPERNISRDELGEAIIEPLSHSDFQETVTGYPTGKIKNTSKYVLLKNDELHPGDKFIVTSDTSIYDNSLADLYIKDTENDKYILKEHPIIALNIVSIEESGKIIYLTSDIKQYEHETDAIAYKYHILGETAMAENESFNQQAIDIDSYRNVLQSGYSVFKQKTSGKLALLAELIMIDSYAVTHSLVPNDKNGFDIILHHEVSPIVDSKNWLTVPKLQYFYLENSQGYLQVPDNISNNDRIDLFVGNDFNEHFLNTKLQDVFVSSVPDLFKDNQTLGSTGEFNFPKKNSYHGDLTQIIGSTTVIRDDTLISKFIANSYYRINLSQVAPLDKDGNHDYKIYLPYYADINAQYYNYTENEKQYSLYDKPELNTSYKYYVKEDKTSYIDAQRNTEHKNKVLYKRGSEIQVATQVQIDNTTIDKYAYQDVIKYTIATPEEINDSSKKKYYKDGDTYTEAKKADYTKTLYVQTIEQNLIYLGPVVEEMPSQGFIYYYSETLEYISATDEDLQTYWDFDSYPMEDKSPYGCVITLYYKTTVENYREVTKQELLDYESGESTFYYRSVYDPIPDLAKYNGELDKLNLYIKFPIDTYIPSSRFKPDEQYNWISGYARPDKLAPEENAIILYKINDYIPQKPTSTNYVPYDDIRLASIQIPEVLTNNYLDLPFIYDYTIVPCMNYGHLDHLKVSNTIDFSNLHKFNQSSFNTWKYRIDGNQLRLTFGADIYDTYESTKVDGLLLEFYDLWGFAGSIEILDKKSYSGKFTKIIPLNTLKAISTTRHAHTELYSRNINIKKVGENSYKYNEQPLGRNENTGWYFGKPDVVFTDNNNDCGTLYSNMLYGVKTYLRRTKNGQHEYIEKENFFLYTIPFFNDYYYTIDNFNYIQSPEIELALTYKLVDNNQINDYNHPELEFGYVKTDYNNIKTYLSGFYDETSLNSTKYYSYSGTTDLYLEIGLKTGYENWNLFYDPAINQQFTCDLQIVSDEDENKEYSINSDIIGPESEILNYNNISPNNYIKFNINNSTDTSLTNFNQYNFINISEENSYIPISIDYEFIVGYKIDITDIKSTEVPATTICALYHKQPDGTYNHSDFGIYQNEEYYLSEKMVYNSGNETQEIFGICRQIQTTGNMTEQCFSSYEEVQEAQKVTIPGKTNTGNSLKMVGSQFGKLQFGQPHVHGFNEDTVTNIKKGEDDKFYLNCLVNTFNNDLFLNPIYNLSINTKNSLKYNSEFISTVTGEYATIDVDDQQTQILTFSGINGTQLATFNQKLLETMKSVYAYNPDYDSLPVNVGKVRVYDYHPIFKTNIISKNAKLDVLNLNDYIYIGPIKFSEYLDELNKHSNINIGNIDQLQLKADLTYCGGINPYLITPLTYNTKAPDNLYSELEFSAKDQLVIKHSDGSNSFLTGSPNKKLLYGYDSIYNKLIQLDVSNYKINESGSLELQSSNVAEKESKNVSIEITPEILSQLFSAQGYNYTYNFVGESGINTSTIINLKLEDPSIQSGNIYKLKAFLPNSNPDVDTEEFQHLYGKSLYVVSDVSSDVTNTNVKLNLKVSIRSDENFQYKANVMSLPHDCKSRMLTNVALNNAVTNYTKKPLYQFNESTLIRLLYQDFSGVLISDDVMQSEYSYVVSGTNTSTVTIDNHDGTITIKKEGSIPNSTQVIVFKVDINNINLNIIRSSSLSYISTNIIYTDTTSKYYHIQSFPFRYYTVRDEYKLSCLRGSYITLNDLSYEPNQEGHRLFVNSNLYRCKQKFDQQIYYRDKNSNNNDPINTLYLFTGPSFTSSNL